MVNLVKIRQRCRETCNEMLKGAALLGTDLAKKLGPWFREYSN